MIQPLYALVFGEVAVILVLLFRTPLWKPLLMLLDRLKQGRGPVFATTAGGTLFVIMASLLCNITTIQTRTLEAGAVNPTDQVLLANQLLEASLLGFSLFLALMIDRIHYYIKEVRMMRKHKEHINKSEDTKIKEKGKSKVEDDDDSRWCSSSTNFKEMYEGDIAMAESVMAVENLLGYRFKQKKLVEEALTHPSCSDSSSYQRLEFVGDAALDLAVSNYVFFKYPDLDPGKLSLLRSANIRTEKLARVAVRHGLYHYLRHNVPALDEKVREFVVAVEEEQEIEIYGGLVKAPKVLADLVESVAAAVYFDCDFDLLAMWKIFRQLLEPIITHDVLEKHQQPVTMLSELCQKDGKKLRISNERRKYENIAPVTVDRKFVTKASSMQKQNAKLLAAKAAIQKLYYGSCDPSLAVNIFNQFNEDGEIEGAKQKLHELCDRKKWPKPNYIIQKEDGPAHKKRYTFSVEIETSEGVVHVIGKEKLRVKEAESSAASVMLMALKNSNYL